MPRPPDSATYMVECFWPGVHVDQVEESGARIRQSAEDLCRMGTWVTFAGSIFVPGDEVVFYLLEGTADAVRSACERAALQFERVVQSVHRDEPR